MPPTNVKIQIFLFFLDGVLHDKALLEALEQQQAANESKNVKRENKAYSYKEQVKINGVIQPSFF